MDRLPFSVGRSRPAWQTALLAPVPGAAHPIHDSTALLREMMQRRTAEPPDGRFSHLLGRYVGWSHHRGGGGSGGSEAPPTPAEQGAPQGAEGVRTAAAAAAASAAAAAASAAAAAATAAAAAAAPGAEPATPLALSMAAAPAAAVASSDSETGILRLPAERLDRAARERLVALAAAASALAAAR